MFESGIPEAICGATGQVDGEEDDEIDGSAENGGPPSPQQSLLTTLIHHHHGKKGRKKLEPSKRAGIEQDGWYPSSTRQDDTKISFLDLAGEVQNEIYLAYLTKSLRIAMPSALSQASKQVHAQMVGQAMFSVTAQVLDFDFARVITFLNRLSEKDVKLLETTGKRDDKAVSRIYIDYSRVI